MLSVYIPDTLASLALHKTLPLQLAYVLSDSYLKFLECGPFVSHVPQVTHFIRGVHTGATPQGVRVSGQKVTPDHGSLFPLLSKAHLD